MTDPATARFVADADVLAADLLVGGPAREALDLARAHDWIEVLASDALLADAHAVIAETMDQSITTEGQDLAEAWLARIEDLVTTVSHPPGDHPALASAVAGDARHVLSLDETLLSPQTNASFQGRIDVSIRPPEAFVSLFDPASMYELAVGGTYPGPDRDPRD